MDFLIVLLLSLAVCPAFLIPPPIVIDVGADVKDIYDLNKDLNLWEGDIMGDKTLQRSAILGDRYRWNGYIPYVLNNSLRMNDKGVILRAFEQLKLKGCVDFKPWTTERDYVSVESLEGCWSNVGRIGGKQQLSIGNGCGTIGTVEHEFLHCLGFYHEQSRYDRDNYVIINYENIVAEMSSNFDKESEEHSTLQGTPYDYTSLMHYGQYYFSNGTEPTIITKDTKFQNVIGQRYDLSPTDALELYMLYKCNESISFLDRCSFDNSMCQMATCSSADATGWQMASNISGGPFSDHTNMPSIGDASLYKNISSEPSSFMHFSTETGQTGDSGRLESREMTPRRACRTQCLEFFYYHSGNETDKLNIWIREYQSNTDITGTLRLMDQITGPPTDQWQLRFVPLDASKPFMVEFEAQKGVGRSKGGFSVDDINLSETECPHNIWQIKNFMKTWNTTIPGSFIYSPLYYSPEGYRYQIILQLNQDVLSVYVRLVSGVHDDHLQWPCPWRQVTFMLLDQNPDVRNRASRQLSLTTDPTQFSNGKPVWGRPSEVGRPTVINGETVNVTDGQGYSAFMKKTQLGEREFVKGGDLILLFSMQDISSLKVKDSLPCPSVLVKNFNTFQGDQYGPCVSRMLPTFPPTTTTSMTTPDTTTPGDCMDIFCSSANIVHPSVLLLLGLVLLVVN